jgi:erythromycin esterase-like protein
MAKPDSPMPEISAFVDALRDAFGAEEINAIVRRGRAGEPVMRWSPPPYERLR